MKKRIDLRLVEAGFFPSREQAQRAIIAGLVRVNGKRIEKPGQTVDEAAEITLAAVAEAYVSRGGYKLAKALTEFNLVVKGRYCLDAGASTGGFTDCLLQAGAAHVDAVDVGYGQLAWKLRQDPRVTVWERQNIRYFPKESLERAPGLITADLSFISLELVFGKFKELIEPGGDLVTLIKPQFEAGRGKVGKKGVVRDRRVHLEVLRRLSENAPLKGWHLVNLTYSPILGPEGNIEYLGHWREESADVIDPEAVVNTAWHDLLRKPD
ncbi:MAG: TlyA family RNA methyltransferase [Firmicutes bacterium]|nr:TlyA family RNA methyltransferase [Bacillota bacterium]